MSAEQHEYDVLIVEQHLDTFGHVNNATYLELFEAARWDLITARGYGLEQIRERKVGPTILDIHIQFKRELRNRQKIRIRTWLEEQRTKIGIWVQQMWNEDNVLCCEARFTVALFDLERRRLIAPTPEWRRVLGLEPASAVGDDTSPAAAPQD